MNRTAVVTAAVVWGAAFALPAQQPTPPPAKPAPTAEADRIDELVRTMQAAEAKLQRVATRLATTGRMPDGSTVSTRGVLHVLRGTQASIHTRVETTFDDGVRSMMESAQTPAGITIYEDDAAFGEVFVQVDRQLVADLEWAGEVLQRDDLPGMKDRRAQSPLGSSMVAAMKRQFQLTVDAGEGRNARNGDEGVWLIGKRRAGLDVQDPELPVADAVELFVRSRDHALLEVRQTLGDTAIQHLVVEQLDVDAELPAKVFEIDGRGQPLRSAREYQPLWEQIEQTILRAETKAVEVAKKKNESLPAAPPVQADVRPSKR